MTFIRKILNRLKLQDERIFLGNFNDWETALKRVKDPTYLSTGTYEYVFTPIMSMGTMTINHVNIPVGVRLKVTQMSDEQLHLQFNAPIRPEFFILFFGFLIATIIILCVTGFSTAFWILLICWPVFTAWFTFIIRAQEEAVIEILTKEIRLYKVRKENASK